MRKPIDLDLSRAWAPISRALMSLRYGTVEIVVHDGRIVQIERREKMRLDVPVQDAPDSRNTPSD
jgi:hypothetical protein